MQCFGTSREVTKFTEVENLGILKLFLDWTGADEDEGDVNVWEDNWDDDNIEDDFSQQLR